MQVKKSNLILFSIFLVSNINAGWYDQWLAARSFFGSIRMPTLQLPQFLKSFKSPTFKKVGLSIGVLAIASGVYWYKNSTQRGSLYGLATRTLEALKKREEDELYIILKKDLFGRSVELSQSSSGYKKQFIGQPGIIKHIWYSQNDSQPKLTVKILNAPENWIFIDRASDEYKVGVFDIKTKNLNIDLNLSSDVATAPEIEILKSNRKKLDTEIINGLNASLRLFEEIPKDSQQDRDNFKEYVLNYLINRFKRIMLLTDDKTENSINVYEEKIANLK